MSQSCIVSKIVPLAESVQSFLHHGDSLNKEADLSCKTIGGILSNSKFAWYANGPRFEVVESKIGRKIASWTFGSILKDTSTKVICLTEIPCLTREVPLLLLGLECALTGGVICVFDILSSKILRAVKVKDKISYLHVVDCGNDIFPVLGPLKAFDGVVAVGLVGGDVLLIDLCQQCVDDARVSSSTEDIKDEVDTCQIIPLTINDIHEVEHHKQRAAQLGHHLAIYLNAILNNRSPHFTLRGPKGEDRLHVNKAEVIVTSLFYCSQLGSLLVGYNFGAWQIWNIINMSLIYTSPVYEENIPISHFAIQEPTDDPRAFCYVWTVYSNTEKGHVGFPVAVLYSLNYETKDFHEGYGYLYQNLQSCAVRFQTELAAIGPTSKFAKGAWCLRLTAFNKGCSTRTSIQEPHEDTLTICSMVWNVWHKKGVDTYMSIFDLNQWYKEQMPGSPQQNCSSYFLYICISDILNKINCDSFVLDAYIDETSINQFIGILKPEEHYFPTALTYEFCTCTNKNITFIYKKGEQKMLLGYFEDTGPLILLKPIDIFQQAVQLGLTPLFVETIQPDINFHREFILNVALEQQMVGFLCKCISTWSNGSYSAMGCSLEFFLNWTWNRANVLKANADKLCESLFDYSEVCLDTNKQKILNSCILQLSNLNRVYGFIRKKVEILPNKADIVNQQADCLQMIVTYLEVLQWLMNVGLLPEFSESTARKNCKLDPAYAPYPIESLIEYYKERRSILQNLNSHYLFNSTYVLYIDNLIENQIGDVLQKYWREDGGDGHYPPPSLQSLLRTYLIENVDLVNKHCIVIYLFLDLAMALNQTRYKFVVTHLIKFPAVFKISSSLIKITQAFWQLDHGDFGTAMDQFLDPIINTADLQAWHHRIILNAFLTQEQYNFALLYFQVRKPPLETTQDILNILSLYVSNHMIDEAISFSREHSSKGNDIKLIQHIFEECQNTNQIRKLICYPLNQKEEEILMKYLEEVSYSCFEQFQVSYYLHRSRYMDIFHMKCREKQVQPSGLVGQKNLNYRDGVIKTISNYFPKVTKDIIDICQREKYILRSEVSRPKPMSVFIHNAEEQAKYKSTIINAGISKSKEIWTHSILHKSLSSEIPFITTPNATSASRKRSSIICPKIINSNITTIEDDVSPKKKIRLSSRLSAVESTTQLNTNEANMSCMVDVIKLSTPIVKRKIQRQTDPNKTENENFTICTPQSILKVRNFVNSQISTTSASIVAVSKDVSLISSNSTSALSLTPRKSVSRSIVRFQKTIDSSPTDSLVVRTTDLTGISSILRSSTEVTKTSSQSEETFYSPNTSMNDNNKKKMNADDKHNEIDLRKAIEQTQVLPKLSQTNGEKTEDIIQVKSVFLRGRSSYRESPSEIQINSRNLDINLQEDGSMVSDSIDATVSSLDASLRKRTRSPSDKSQECSALLQARSSLVATSPRRTSLRISKRKSLSRIVLENNALSASNTNNNAPQELSLIEPQNQDKKQSINIDVSAISSLTSEDFDRIINNQSFDVPHISLSLLQNTSSFEINASREKLVDTNNEIITKKMGNENVALTAISDRIQKLSPLEPLNEDIKQSIYTDVSSINSLASEDFDRMVNNQCIDVPQISLSLMHNTSSFETNVSKENVVDTNSEIVSKEKDNEYVLKLREPQRSSLNIGGRKSLNRIVLERNTFSKMYTSTPYHSNQSSFIEKSSNGSAIIKEKSESNSSAAMQLDHTIKDQTFDILHHSLSLNQYSTDNDMYQEDDISSSVNVEVSEDNMRNKSLYSDAEKTKGSLTIPRTSRLSGRKSIKSTRKDISKIPQVDLRNSSLSLDIVKNTDDTSTELVKIAAQKFQNVQGYLEINNSFNDVKNTNEFDSVKVSETQEIEENDKNGQDVLETKKDSKEIGEIFLSKKKEVFEPKEVVGKQHSLEIIEIKPGSNEVVKTESDFIEMVTPVIEKSQPEVENISIPKSIQEGSNKDYGKKIEYSKVIKSNLEEMQITIPSREMEQEDDELNEAQLLSTDIIEISDNSSCNSGRNSEDINYESAVTDGDSSAETINSEECSVFDVEKLGEVTDIESLNNAMFSLNDVTTENVELILKHKLQKEKDVVSDVFEDITIKEDSNVDEKNQQFKTCDLKQDDQMMDEDQLAQNLNEMEQAIVNHEDQNVHKLLLDKVFEEIESNMETINDQSEKNIKSSSEENHNVEYLHNIEMKTQQIDCWNLKLERNDEISSEQMLNIQLVTKSKENNKSTLKNCSDVNINASKENERNISEISEKTLEKHILENTSTEAHVIQDILPSDILDIDDIERTTCVTIPISDILEKSSISNLNDTTEMFCEDKQEFQKHENIHEVVKSEIEEDNSKMENTQQVKSPILFDKMQLRKRRLSSTSVESLINSTISTRSVSVNDINFQQKKSMQVMLQSTSGTCQRKSKRLHLNKDVTIEKTTRSLRNRRAVSVSEISSYANETQSIPKRRSKRTASISSLPIISQENVGYNKEKDSSKQRETDQDEKSIDDELEIYSTTRRLTRNQKNLLERSKEKRCNSKKIATVSLPNEPVINLEVDPDRHLNSSPSTESESAPSSYIRTRRISQDSTSSVVTTANSISDTGTPRKKRTPSIKSNVDSPFLKGLTLRSGRSRSVDEASTISQISNSSRVTRKSGLSDSDNLSTTSLRRSARHRSQTPDSERSSKVSTAAKKVLSKILEESDDEIKEEPPLKQRRSKGRK